MENRIRFFNTLTRNIELFVPNEDGKVKMYTCGPTVYHYAHIGNLRSYIMEDILEKTLRYVGYDVKRVMNITDVGHLSSDADTGEDKMLKGAKREHKTVMEIAKFYTDAKAIVTTAYNGFEAVEKIKKSCEDGVDSRYDVILMDIMMPEMNGLEASMAIREMGMDYTDNIPIIAMTANAFTEDVKKCFEAKMSDHISKPIDIDKVTNAERTEY